MNIAPYRLVLRQPGMTSLMLVGLLARIPVTATGIATTLHVITSLELGYAEAGLAAALIMAGSGVGAPIAGRLIDRVGARPVIAVTSVAQAVFWTAAPSLPYRWLLVSGFVAGVLSVPIFSALRQFIAAMAPEQHRRTAFALDAMSVEVSFMAGPALAVAAITSFGSSATMYGVGAGLALAGMSLVVLNPPTRSAKEEEQAPRVVSRRQWLTPSFVFLLGVTTTATFTLSATELSVVAVLGESGAVGWTGLVIAMWCVYSLVGGLIYGAWHRAVSPLLLVGAMGALTIPVGLVGGGWWWLAVALVPAGLLCAPSLTAIVDTVNAWVPASVRGEAMGLHATALTIGVAAGSPVAGAVIDAFGPGWGFATAGGVAVALVLAALPFWPRQSMPKTEPAPTEQARAREEECEPRALAAV